MQCVGLLTCAQFFRLVTSTTTTTTGITTLITKQMSVLSYQVANRPTDRRCRANFIYIRLAFRSTYVQFTLTFGYIHLLPQWIFNYVRVYEIKRNFKCLESRNFKLLFFSLVVSKSFSYLNIQSWSIFQVKAELELVKWKTVQSRNRQYNFVQN